MKFKLRDYQEEAASMAVSFLLDKTRKGNGIIVVPTGGGKSLCIAEVVKRLDSHVLILQPSKEILEQNIAKLRSYGFDDCSIYSASCGEKEISRATYATIGSIKNETARFKHFKYCIIDECDVVNPKGGMYYSFLKAVGCKTVGFTATPYRLHTTLMGSMLRFITRTRPRFFTDVLYYQQVGEMMNRGYLSRMQYFDLLSIDMQRLHVNSTGQNYTDRSVRIEFKRSGFAQKLANVVERLLYNAKVPRKGVLVFTQFVEESEELVRAFPGVSAIVTGETPKKEREQILEDFKSGRIKVVCNVNCLSVGFDYPELDTIVLARPTMSLRLYYQQVGRAIRPHKDKAAAWVIDLCGTYRTFGRVEDLRMRDSGNGKWIIESGRKQLTNVLMT